MLYAPYSITTIHTWDHLALATHMKAGLNYDPQVALTTDVVVRRSQSSDQTRQVVRAIILINGAGVWGLK